MFFTFYNKLSKFAFIEIEYGNFIMNINNNLWIYLSFKLK